MAALLGSLSFLSLIVAILARSVPFSDSGAINRGGSCILDVNNDLPKKNEPLLLSQSPSGFSLLLPEGHGRQGIINLQEGEAIYVACTGQRNAIEWTNHVTDKAVCRSGSLLSVNGRDLKSVDLDCRSRAEAKTKVTNRPCANGKGIIVELGFEAMGWHKMIDVCHNLAQMSTYYSAHTINGARLAGKVYRTTGRPLFAKGDPPLYRGTNPDAAYKLKNQEVVLSQLLGPQVARSLLDQRSNHFLSRGHLAPDADFLLSPHQFLTYFFVNVAPQWQSINGGNWLKIETDTRNLAKRVEGGLIDKGHHSGRARVALHEVLSLNDAVNETMLLLDKLGIKEETLVIVTSDHVHTLSLSGYPDFGSNIFGIADKSLIDGMPYNTLSYANSGKENFHFTAVEGSVVSEDPSTVDTTSFDYHVVAPVVTDMNTHGGSDVFVYAAGPHAHLFHTLHENTYIATVIAYASKIGQYSRASRLHLTSLKDFSSNELFFVCLSVFTVLLSI